MSPSDFSFPRRSLWPDSLREAGLLLLVTAVLTAGSWLARPDRLPLSADPAVYELELAAPLLEIPDALALFDEGAHLFIDTRDLEPGSQPTISGAFVIRESTFDDDLLALFDDLFPEDPVILFGDGDLVGTNNVAGRLLARGFSDVQILRGGLQGWQAAGGDLGSPYVPAAPEGGQP
jgi:rhodanese-related sulfurtransferase